MKLSLELLPEDVLLGLHILNYEAADIETNEIVDSGACVSVGFVFFKITLYL